MKKLVLGALFVLMFVAGQGRAAGQQAAGPAFDTEAATKAYIASMPLEEAIFYDHPSGHTRIFSAMRWKAEHPEVK